ncbi:MAG: 6-phospho-beta-glucosidase [Chloroflexota bacterium]
MKLVLIGAGVRAPLFVSAALRRASRLSLAEITLLDIDPERAHLFGGLASAVAHESGTGVRVTVTTDPHVALVDAAHVVTSIRVGNEAGRVADERIALRHDVLGQETTGPGGFAMALRNVPAILGYADLVRELSPRAWLYNFTNPAGLVTQALHDHGVERVVGICDSGNVAQRSIAQWLQIPERDLQAETFGLNHLSWTRSVRRGGQDVLPAALGDPAFLAQTTQAMFEPELRELVGMWMNEYLFYWYYYERALASLRSAAQTRGEEIAQLTGQLMDQLRTFDIQADPARSLELFDAYQGQRVSTYMRDAKPAPTDHQGSHAAIESEVPSPIAGLDEGYAGVMLDVIEAIEGGAPVRTVLNVPNDGSIEGVGADDVVEVSCEVDENGARPVRIGAVPELPLALIRSVKLFERLTIESIRERSRLRAIEALMAHPMVMSYSRARVLVDEYGVAHERYVPWLT